MLRKARMTSAASVYHAIRVITYGAAGRNTVGLFIKAFLSLTPGKQAWLMPIVNLTPEL